MAAARRMEIVLVLSAILSATLSLEAVAQSDCQEMLESLTPCYAYISQSGSSPSPQCCHQAGIVLQTQPKCLCVALNQDGLNKTRLLELPKACNLQTPPVSDCYSSPPPQSGHSIKNSYPLLLFALAAASWAVIFLVV